MAGKIRLSFTLGEYIYIYICVCVCVHMHLCLYDHFFHLIFELQNPAQTTGVVHHPNTPLDTATALMLKIK